MTIESEAFRLAEQISIRINRIIQCLKDELEDQNDWHIDNKDVEFALSKLLHNALDELNRAKKVLDAHNTLILELGQINGS